MKYSSFMQDAGARWLKGNLHCHSTHSDGTLTPAELKHLYQHHGYDFLVMSDHDCYTDCQNLSTQDFTMINGAEITGYTHTEKRVHINVMWTGDEAGIASGQKFTLKNHAETAELMAQLRSKGCYLMLNHPHWSMLEYNDVCEADPYHAVEIYNYSTEWIENMGESSIFWEELLRRGLRVWNGGSDDNHNRYEADSQYCDSFGGFTIVKAAGRTEAHIIDALKNGSFYTSTGPSISEFYVEDGFVHVQCSPCVRIIVNGNQHQYQRKLGKYVTEFSAKLLGTETFVRVECMDAAGRSAYSNPLFLHQRSGGE